MAYATSTQKPLKKQMGYAKENNFTLGIDIGGGTVKAAMYKRVEGQLEESPIWSWTAATQKGLREHSEQIATMIQAASEEAQNRQNRGVLKAIGIGSPGRFKDGVIKPGTNPNLARTDGEFDNINLKDSYLAALKKKNPRLATLPLHVHNDGNAMLVGMLEALQKNSDKDIYLENRTVGLFGIGTGLGHAIADIDRDGGFNFVTDGHASKLLVTVDDNDMAMIKKAASLMNTPEKEEVVVRGNQVRAEDLFRAPVIQTLAGVSSNRDIDPTNPEHKKVLDFAGKYMGRLIALIKSGESEDLDPVNGWSRNDKAAAAKTSAYLIGGGVGSSPLGAALIKRANEELKALEIKGIQLIQFPKENVATRAAATMVPQSAYEQSFGYRR